jgi:hypothetical protein
MVNRERVPEAMEWLEIQIPDFELPGKFLFLRKSIHSTLLVGEIYHPIYHNNNITIQNKCKHDFMHVIYTFILGNSCGFQIKRLWVWKCNWTNVNSMSHSP